ncbi:DUF2092 domain-containing protein [Stappia stellulata]|uniref:DUF2092 domain-containing protein n=1 Tax=Stappia stellulata TaxID=71235 RepID=UPI0004171ACE|nr:DUF2092 domain-containing protein [Stappia stellulata]
MTATILSAFLVAQPLGAAEIDPDAEDVLRGMCEALGGLEAFTVTSAASTEVILQDGRKLQLVATTNAIVDRGAGFRFTRQGAFGAVEVVFDGATLTVWSEATGGYAATQAAGDLDAGLDALLATFGESAAGGADLLYADPCSNLMNGVDRGDYIGVANIDGQSAHHIYYRAAEHDWQLWISTEAPALPVRYVITSKWVTGAPQFIAQFRDWSLGAQDDFAFAAPEGARELGSAEVVLEGVK